MAENERFGNFLVELGHREEFKALRDLRYRHREVRYPHHEAWHWIRYKV